MNGVNGMNDIEGKVAMGSDERGGRRASFKHRFEQKSIASKTSVKICVNLWLKALFALFFCAVAIWSFADGDQAFTPKISELPFAKIAMLHDIDRFCPNTGKKDNNPYHYAQNAAKNNFTAKGVPIPILFSDFDRLQQASQQKIDAGEIKLEGKYPADRKTLQSLIKIDEKPVGEGTIVRLEAYVFNAEYVNTKFNLDSEGHGRHGEAVDCDNPELDWNDMHLALCEKADANTDECWTVTAEISPHYRPAMWSRFHDGQNALVEAIVPGLLKGKSVQNREAGTEPLRVRLTGPLFYDASHRPCLFNGKEVTERHGPWRRSIWEVHPVYRIEVLDANRKDWVDLDQWDQTKPRIARISLMEGRAPSRPTETAAKLVFSARIGVWSMPIRLLWEKRQRLCSLLVNSDLHP
jgi:hypothetical protein